MHSRLWGGGQSTAEAPGARRDSDVLRAAFNVDGDFFVPDAPSAHFAYARRTR
jgi:hypothetical protein